MDSNPFLNVIKVMIILGTIIGIGLAACTKMNHAVEGLPCNSQDAKDNIQAIYECVESDQCRLTTEDYRYMEQHMRECKGAVK